MFGRKLDKCRGALQKRASTFHIQRGVRSLRGIEQIIPGVTNDRKRQTPGISFFIRLFEIEAFDVRQASDFVAIAQIEIGEFAKASPQCKFAPVMRQVVAGFFSLFDEGIEIGFGFGGKEPGIGKGKLGATGDAT